MKIREVDPMLRQRDNARIREDCPEVNVIKLFTLDIFLWEALVFVPGMPFQPSLMFAIKARAFPSGAPERC